MTFVVDVVVVDVVAVDQSIDIVVVAVVVDIVGGVEGCMMSSMLPSP